MQQTLFAWWYASIAIGFVLLAVRSWLVGAEWWGVVLRAIIAIGFGVLAAFTFRSRPRTLK